MIYGAPVGAWATAIVIREDAVRQRDLPLQALRIDPLEIWVSWDFSGQTLALDVMSEYVLFLKAEPEEEKEDE